MKRYIMFATLFCFSLRLSILFGQQEKPIIDSNAIKSWISFGRNINVKISNDGAYFCYPIDSGYPARSGLIIKSTTENWAREFYNAKPVAFPSDNKKFIFLNKDSLGIISLGGAGDIKYITDVGAMRQPADKKGDIIVYQKKSSNRDLVVLNVLTGQQQIFNNVIDYQISDNANTLFLRMSSNRENNNSSLQIFDIPTSTVLANWNFKDSTFDITSIAIDKMGEQVAFQTKKGSEETGVWYWKTGMNEPVRKIDWPLNQKAKDLFILPSLRFSSNGQHIYILLQPYRKPIPLQDAVSVDVWDTKDTIIQSTQLKKTFPAPYIAAVNVSSGKFMQITSDWDVIRKFQTVKGNYAVITHNAQGDRFWLNIPDSNWLVSLDGSSKVLLKTRGFCSFEFSPNGNYLLYYDAGQRGHYFSYNLQTGKVKDVSSNIPNDWLIWEHDFYLSKHKTPIDSSPDPVGIAGFSEGDKAAFVYDDYDIWKLDLSGLSPAVNVTNGYGRKTRTKFRVLTEGIDAVSVPVLPTNKSQVLSAFNTKTQHNGFYKTNLLNQNNPVPLTMTPSFFYFGVGVNREVNNFSSNFRPLKASNSNKWLVKRESTDEAPNFFLTEDFVLFKKLTELEPHKKYNWLTADLVSFQRSDGITVKGILYKPENFDSTKRYPVLFNIYQTFSERRYQFPTPGFTGTASINIPWFTSQGYLIFTPDLYVTGPGLNMKSALLTVQSAIAYLAKYSFIDSMKIGLTGHSFAGGLVAYIVSHTAKFAAAFEGAGNTDPISAMLAIDRNFLAEAQLIHENSYGATMWQRPDLYLENSAILSANKISTPLLIFHCKNDGGVLFEQGMELFLALRRLDKTAWLLQYDRGDHTVTEKAAEDLTIRTNQFFDYYLKGKSIPKWMEKGVPARLKGVEYRYELE